MGLGFGLSVGREEASAQCALRCAGGVANRHPQSNDSRAQATQGGHCTASMGDSELVRTAPIPSPRPRSHQPYAGAVSCPLPLPAGQASHGTQRPASVVDERQVQRDAHRMGAWSWLTRAPPGATCRAAEAR